MRLMEFAAELARVLPNDIPHRERLIEKASAHLSLILAANEHFNLTRIINAPEAAIKHVFDSVVPWRHFAGARRVLDAGTGAGFPGIPLSVVLPDVRFTLAESTQKKARFVDSAVESLDRLLDLFAKPMQQGAKLILYKGPEVENELAAVRKYRIKAEQLSRYELPDHMGTRVLLSIEAVAR